MRFTFILLMLLTSLSCRPDKNTATVSTTGASAEVQTPYEQAVADPLVQFKGLTIDTRFLTPAGYSRIPVSDTSFAHYLRKLPLKTPGAEVHYYDGAIKPYKVHAAVVDLKIGDKDLHQCADAIMRLKAEHHWLQKEYDKIHFNFTNGYKVAFTEWQKGRNMIVKGNKTYWDNGATPRKGYASFWEYLELIFMYAGTLSLEKETLKIPIDQLTIGDIFIQGGSPGHAIIIVDLAENDAGEKIFMLAQSYMPAQEIHILVNGGQDLSPWYSIPNDGQLRTPEWSFTTNDIRRFAD